MTISLQNRALLERKLRNAPAMTDPDMKIRLPVSGICTLLDEARAEGLADGVRLMAKHHKPGSVESILQEMGKIMNGGRP